MLSSASSGIVGDKYIFGIYGIRSNGFSFGILSIMLFDNPVVVDTRIQMKNIGRGMMLDEIVPLPTDEIERNKVSYFLKQLVIYTVAYVVYV